MSARDGGPAFPTSGQPWGDPDGRQRDPASHGWLVDPQAGMSLRDYFAAKAMQGMLANTDKEDRALHIRGKFAALLAANAYEFADAMLAAREARP